MGIGQPGNAQLRAHAVSAGYEDRVIVIALKELAGKIQFEQAGKTTIQLHDPW